MSALTTEQVRQYEYDGFLFPMPALSPAERQVCLDGVGRLEAWLGTSMPEADRKWRSAPYTYLPWADDLVRHCAILDVVEAVIGPDILVYTATFFIKEPGTEAFAAWHQDATYFGLHPFDHVTAWVALTDATCESGCMDVVSSRGAPRQMHHAAARLANSINGAGQVIVEPVDESHTTAMELPAGNFSLHHTLCAHRSAPNRSNGRRIGLGISYVPAHVRSTGSYRMPALLVRGSGGSNFDLLDRPSAELDPAGIARHEAVYRRYRENYFEQAERHERDFATAPA